MFGKQYLGGASPRSRLEGNFFTSTEAPESYVISFHTEMCYLQQRPGKVYFYCEVAPERFGETPVFDCAGIVETLPEDLVAKIAELGVTYQRYLLGKPAKVFNVYKTWMDSLDASSKDEAEAAAAQQGMSLHWHKNGNVTTRTKMPGLVVHPTTGKRCISLTFI